MYLNSLFQTSELMNGAKAASEGSQIKESSESLQAATVCSVCTGPHPGPLQVCDIR